MATKKFRDYSSFDFYGEEISDLSKESYKDFFKKQKETDKWNKIKMSDIEAYGLENNMLTVTDNEDGSVSCESRQVNYFTEKIYKKSVKVNCSLADIERCLEGDTATRLVLKFLTDKESLCYPVARTAREGLYGRTGTGFTRVFNSLGEDVKLTEFNPYARASMVNEHAHAWKYGEMTVLTRDNRLIACHSDTYSILPIADLIDEVENVLTTRYGAYSFVEGKVSNSFTKIIYNIDDEKLAKQIKPIYENTNYADYDIGIMFTSSDIGNNCATANCVLYKDDRYIIISKEHKLKHAGKVVPEDFKLEVEKCFASVTEIMAQLKAMSNEEVHFLPDMVRRIGATIGLNKKLVCDYAQNLPQEGTQFDVYMCICDITAQGLGEFTHSPEMVFKANELANEMLYIKNLASFDAKFEWVENVKFS